MEGKRQKEREPGSSRPPRQRRCGVYPADSSARVIVTARRLVGASLLGRRIGILVGFAKTIAAQQEDLGVFDEPVGDGRIKEDVAPVGERSIGRNYRRAFVAVARRDHLIKEVGGLLVESQVSQFVADEE